MLWNGGFVICQTNNPFACDAVYLTLEQTIDGDAASWKTGIDAFAASDDAHQRWTIIHTYRAVIVTNLLEMAWLKETGYTYKECTNHRIRHDNDNLQVVMLGIGHTMNALILSIMMIICTIWPLAKQHLRLSDTWYWNWEGWMFWIYSHVSKMRPVWANQFIGLTWKTSVLMLHK